MQIRPPAVSPAPRPLNAAADRQIVIYNCSNSNIYVTHLCLCLLALCRLRLALRLAHLTLQRLYRRQQLRLLLLQGLELGRIGRLG